MTRAMRFVVLYMALALGANAAAAQELSDLVPADMRGLVIHDAPQPVTDAPFLDMQDAEGRLSDYRGRVVVLNFWATWCAPCREEMPSLDALQRELGGEDFTVLALATGRNPLPAIDRFFEQVGITDLPVIRDPGQRIAQVSAVLGLPTTLILDREGQEIARLTGTADWASDEAIAFLRALIGAGA